MRFPSAAKFSVDRLAEAGAEAECGNSPLAIAVSRGARTKATAPVITKVKTANPATAFERRNVLKAVKGTLTIPRLTSLTGVKKPRGLQTTLPESPPTSHTVDAKEGRNVLFC
jgi:hypothetical protein